MKQFIYEPGHLALDTWPSGELRLEGIEITREIALADVFVCPGSLALFRQPRDLYRLPYFMGNEEKHVFLDVSDYETKYNQPSIFIRCNLRKFNLDADPNSIQQAWPVEDYAECIEVPEGGFKYDISGQMWLSSEVRKQSAEACRNNPLLKSDIATYPDFCGYLHDRTTNEWSPEGKRRRAEFRRSMKESRICLCPESIVSVFPYRYFEALSAGRVPLLIGSGFIYPWANEIQYESFAITCPRNLADKADEFALDFIQSHSDEEIIEMGKLGRQAWEKWLDSRLWPKLHAIAVERKLEEMKAAA